MKRVFLILIITLVSGCGELNNKYINSIADLDRQLYSSDNIPFNIEISLDELIDTEWRYTVVIDNPVKKFTEVSALVIHNYELSDVFPSVGIVDEPVNLSSSSDVDYSKGIILVGYIPSKFDEIEFKVMIEYKDDDEIKKVYFVEKLTK